MSEEPSGKVSVADALPRKPLRHGREVGIDANGYVVLNEQTGNAYCLPPAVYAIWTYCNGETTVEDISSRVSVEAEVPIEQAREVIVAVLNALADVGLISW
ncbi:MAG: hypothetical protein DRJ31_03625 [Candidatus Methanomethylicota archaeon]|uniref:PqqD family protein n=1 Tax=Thermoproteota archaeon TaxID=2056631 RepID=A0A497ES90_9CREN|nr:MAG: hypothetical protein DRJ31_03625 [Candidatus Verstraetearchaeota archaeon]